MITTTKISTKKIYLEPQIECVKLDHEISLALESLEPPLGPDEVLNVPEHFNSNLPTNTFA